MVLVCDRRLKGCGYVGRQWDFENPDAGLCEQGPTPLIPNQPRLDFEEWMKAGNHGEYPGDIEHESDFLTSCPECCHVGAVNQVTPETLYRVDPEYWGKASRLLGLELGFHPKPPRPPCLWICNVHEGGCGYVGSVGEWRYLGDYEGSACPACGHLTASNILSPRWLFCVTTPDSWQKVSAMVGELDGFCPIPGPNQKFGGSIEEVLFGKEVSA